MSDWERERQEAVVAALRDEGWLRQIDWYPRIDSTNRCVRERLAEDPDCELPWLVVADQQTHGRGRGDHRWWSPEGCLMATLAWRPRATPRAASHAASQLPLVVGLALADACRPWIDDTAPVRVKWPNDVYVGDRKLAGILIESLPGQRFVIGWGLNVDVDFSQAPSDVIARATSIAQQVRLDRQSDLGRAALLRDLLGSLRVALEGWQHEEDWLMARWRDACYLTGHRVAVASAEGTREGRCSGIDAEGALRLLEHDGQTYRCVSGTVTRLD